jgi:hypothetical protein
LFFSTYNSVYIITSYFHKCKLNLEEKVRFTKLP